MTELSNKEISKKLRCLRMNLSPTSKEDIIQLLEEAEKRLNGAVSTVPAASAKRRSQGSRITKQQVYNKYFYK